MRTKLIFAFLSIAVAFPLLAGGEKAVELTPEENWARGIADDFWKAVLHDGEGRATGLIAPEFKTALDVEAKRSVFHPLGALYIGENGTYSIAYGAIEMSPENNEVILKGSLVTKSDYPNATGKREFKMRIAKSNSNVWMIRYFMIDTLTERKK